MYEYYEIVGSEKPIYTEKPNDLVIYEDIPSGQFGSYEEVAYLETETRGQNYYLPLFEKVGEA